MDFWDKVLGVPQGKSLYGLLKLGATMTLQALGVIWGTDPQDSTQILDDTLNAADEGTLTQTVTFVLAGGVDQLPVPWLNGVGTLSPFGTFGDGDIGLPSVQGGNEVEIVAGAGAFTIIFDTDAGATKDYAYEDFMGVGLTKIVTDEGIEIGLNEAITFLVSTNS